MSMTNEGYQNQKDYEEAELKGPEESLEEWAENHGARQNEDGEWQV